MTIALTKKNNTKELRVGVRTRDGGGTAENDYEQTDKEITFKKRDVEQTFEVKIHDNEQWQPDLDFFVELYDLDTQERLSGDDTECRVLILDEDFPGTL